MLNPTYSRNDLAEILLDTLLGRGIQRLQLRQHTGKIAAIARQQPAGIGSLQIADAIGATVKIKANKKGVGEVSIRFSSLDQLDGLLSRLR